MRAAGTSVVAIRLRESCGASASAMGGGLVLSFISFAATLLPGL